MSTPPESIVRTVRAVLLGVLVVCGSITAAIWLSDVRWAATGLLAFVPILLVGIVLDARAEQRAKAAKAAVATETARLAREWTQKHGAA